MSSFHIAATLLDLTKEINKKYGAPLWPTGSIGDGAVGDTSHQARKSDHNPDWSANGVIRAIDIGIEGRNAREILNTVIGDPRVWYVIHKGIIYSRTHGWRALRYTGSNSHPHHIHVSIRGADGISRANALWIENLKKPWFESKTPKKISVIDFSNIKKQFVLASEGKKVSKLYGVEVVQRNLNRVLDLDLKVDGLVGKSTLDAWGLFEKKRLKNVEGRPRVPNSASDLRKLVPVKVKE